MKEFIFLIRLGNTPFTAEQTALLQQKWGKLTTGLRAENRFVDGYVFSGGGHTLQGSDDITIIPETTMEDGRQAAGMVVIKAADITEALQIARLCPPLEFGGTVEVRERQPTPAPQPQPAITN
jgi:hypothetical protein